MVFKVVPKKRKRCLWITGGLGALIFAGSFVCIFVAFPALIDWQVDLGYDLWNKESVGYKNFVCEAIIKFGTFSPEVLALKHKSRILGQWSNPVSGSRKSQASSPWAKQHRV